MKYIKTIVNAVISKIIPKALPKPVGRWSMEECNVKINARIDLSNEDHCGPCGQYILNKEQPANPNKNLIVDKKVMTK
jgi:hypothetical protein